MMKYTLIVFFCFGFFLPAQEFLTPEAQISFGLNNHTNRDISYFHAIDEFDNVISVGTTERDSSFTDIILTKLDNDLNLTWQKFFSEDTDLSYDIPISLDTDNDNNIYIGFRSSHNASNTNGDAGLVKYNPNGDKLWNINLTELLQYDVFDYNYFKVYVNDDNSINIIYSPVNYEGNSNTYHFLTFDTEGVISNQYSINLNSNFFKENYINGKYVLFYNEPIDDNFTDFDFFIRIIDYDNDQSYQLNTQSEFPNNLNISNLEHFNFLTDANHISYIIWQEYNISEINEINYTKINDDGTILYNSNSSLNISSFYLSSFINNNSRLCILSNNSTQADPNSLNFTLNEYDLNGEILSNQIDSNTITNSVKIDINNSIFAFTQDNRIKLYNEGLMFLSESTVTTNNNINDISKTTSNEFITSETSLDKMYPESDYFTQLNIVINKYDSTNLLSNYSYSGVGTSKINGMNVLIDNEDNYYVLINEKYGPDNTSLGGSRAPEFRRIEKFDDNFNLIWKLDINNDFISEKSSVVDDQNNLYVNTSNFNPETNQVNYELLKISSSGELMFQAESRNGIELQLNNNNDIILFTNEYNDSNYEFEFRTYTYSSVNGTPISQLAFESQDLITSFKDENNDFYIYTYTGQRELGDDNPTLLFIYKNMELFHTLTLNMNVSNEEIDLVSLSNKSQSGSICFGSSAGQNYEKLHKVTLSGNYTFISVNDRITRTAILENGDIFFIIRDNSVEGAHVEIYDENLTFKHSGQSVFNWSNIFLVNQFIFLYRHFDSSFDIFNHGGNLIDKLMINGNLYSGSLNSENKFIISGTFGNQIYTFQQYSWTRGFLGQYGYDTPLDTDNDGIGDSIDLCAETPFGEEVSDQGCSLSQIDSDSDGVFDDIDQCPFTDSGLEVNEVGCALNQIDLDMDGIFDDVDLCTDSVLIEFVNENGCFELPPNNFVVETVSETCPGENNGKIIIQTLTQLNYKAIFNDTTYNFNNSLEIENLSPGNYPLLISIDEEGYEQIFNLTIQASNNLVGRFNYTQGLLSVEIDQGTLPFNIYINNELINTSNSYSFFLPVNPTDEIIVRSDKNCEGELLYCERCTGSLKAYPNPTSDLVFIRLGHHQEVSSVKIYDTNLRLLNKIDFTTEDNMLKIDLAKFSNGVYYIEINDEMNNILKIVKI